MGSAILDLGPTLSTDQDCDEDKYLEAFTSHHGARRLPRRPKVLLFLRRDVGDLDALFSLQEVVVVHHHDVLDMATNAGNLLYSAKENQVEI